MGADSGTGFEVGFALPLPPTPFSLPSTLDSLEFRRWCHSLSCLALRQSTWSTVPSGQAMFINWKHKDNSALQCEEVKRGWRSDMDDNIIFLSTLKLSSFYHAYQKVTSANEMLNFLFFFYVKLKETKAWWVKTHIRNNMLSLGNRWGVKLWFYIETTKPQCCGFTQLSEAEWHRITWMITNNSLAESQLKRRQRCNYSPLWQRLFCHTTE